MRRTGMLLASAACVAVTGGCAATPFACTEIGYVNSVTLQVTGARAAEVDDLAWCVAGECDGGELADARGLGGGEWTADTFVQTPTQITVVARDADGVEVSRTDVTVSWTATDAPNGPGCDNASDASTVTVSVP